jgi:hypothetical protein
VKALTEFSWFRHDPKAVFSKYEVPWSYLSVLYTHTSNWSGKYRRRTANVYSLEYTHIPKVFFMPNHVGHCCTNVMCKMWSKNDLRSLLHWCCNWNGGSTGEQGAAGQGTGKVAYGEKSLKVQSLRPGSNKDASWERPCKVKPQRFSNPGLKQALGALPGYAPKVAQHHGWQILLGAFQILLRPKWSHLTGQRPRDVQNSEGKTMGAMPQRGTHQSEGAKACGNYWRSNPSQHNCITNNRTPITSSNCLFAYAWS